MICRNINHKLHIVVNTFCITNRKYLGKKNCGYNSFSIY